MAGVRAHYEKKSRPSVSYRPCLEALEDRLAPAGLSVPAYDSLPGAQAAIYLDFNGDKLDNWLGYKDIKIPAYDTDGNRSSFSNSELAAIKKIWRYAAEDFAPFNINVTTVDPRRVAGFTGRVSQVDIGGTGSWVMDGIGGYGMVGGFDYSSASDPVRAFVFPKNLGNGHPKYVGDAVAHEAGHNMGLDHIGKYSGSSLTEEYYAGPGDGTGPLMGNSYFATRSLWWYGRNTYDASMQNDLDVIAANQYVAYRPDDYGNSVEAAGYFSLVGDKVRAAGVVEKMGDVDYFRFYSGAGKVTFSVKVAKPYNNLAAKLELRDANDNLIDSAKAGSSFDVSITTTLKAGGTYYLVVKSCGPSSGSSDKNYGINVGKYTVTGTVLAAAAPVDVPATLTAANTAGGVALSWQDLADNELGYRALRSDDGGASWNTIATLSPNSASYLDETVSWGWSYQYRVQAFTETEASFYSNPAKVTTPETTATSVLEDSSESLDDPTASPGAATAPFWAAGWEVEMTPLQHPPSTESTALASLRDRIFGDGFWKNLRESAEESTAPLIARLQEGLAWWQVPESFASEPLLQETSGEGI